jgi:hypothetical protein
MSANTTIIPAHPGIAVLVWCPPMDGEQERLDCYPVVAWAVTDGAEVQGDDIVPITPNPVVNVDWREHGGALRRFGLLYPSGTVDLPCGDVTFGDLSSFRRWCRDQKSP